MNSFVLLALPEKLLRCLGITTPLNQDIQDIPILIHGTPQVIPLSLNPNKDLIKIPSIARSTYPISNALRVLCSKS